MDIYREIDGLRYTMEQLYNTGGKDQFPLSKGNLISSFKYIEDYMNTHCHPNTVAGAAAHGDGLLTDHGVDHVKMVIANAGNLIGDMKYHQLKCYEIYLLLLAIHFHDVGNVLGRADHEKKINAIMVALGDQLPLDMPEKVIVSNIAMSHGGYADVDRTDKDTLCRLNLVENCNGIIIRPALLGAILRFADELSDDSTRTSRYMNDAHAIPDENKIFHAYSSALSPISFNGNTISFQYYILLDQVRNKIPNPDGKFLYDEIISRLKKCMQELEYCQKYSEGFIRITTLSVTINVMDPTTTFTPLCSTKFSLRLSGYPNGFTISDKTLEFKTGEELLKHFESKEEVE